MILPTWELLDGCMSKALRLAIHIYFPYSFLVILQLFNRIQVSMLYKRYISEAIWTMLHSVQFVSRLIKGSHIASKLLHRYHMFISSALTDLIRWNYPRMHAEFWKMQQTQNNSLWKSSMFLPLSLYLILTIKRFWLDEWPGWKYQLCVCLPTTCITQYSILFSTMGEFGVHIFVFGLVWHWNMVTFFPLSTHHLVVGLSFTVVDTCWQ